MSVLNLGQLVTNLRFEIGHSPSPAAGINQRDELVYVLNRTQEELASGYDWPGLVVDRDIAIVPGTRYYAYPSDLPYDNIENVYLVWTTSFSELAYGIGPDQFALFNSNTGYTSWPVQRWMNHLDSGTMELWPIPSQAPPATATSQAALVRLRGTKLIPPMVADADMCVFPATAILLWAAAEYLAREKSADAALRLDKAKEYLRRLRVREGANKQKPFVIGGGSGGGVGRIGIDYVPIGYGNGPGR